MSAYLKIAIVKIRNFIGYASPEGSIRIDQRNWLSMNGFSVFPRSQFWGQQLSEKFGGNCHLALIYYFRDAPRNVESVK